MNICSNVQDLIKIGKSRPFLFKYLEYYNTLTLEHEISAVHHFQVNYKIILLLSGTSNNKICPFKYFFVYQCVNVSFTHDNKIRHHILGFTVGVKAKGANFLQSSFV